MGEVLVVSMYSREMVEKTFNDLFNTLSNRAIVTSVSKPKEVIDYLDSNKPCTVLVTDPGIQDRENAVTLNKIRQYTIDGGCTVFALAFAHSISLPEMNLFQRKFLCPLGSLVVIARAPPGTTRVELRSLFS
jgi:hypothetical protein